MRLVSTESSIFMRSSEKKKNRSTKQTMPPKRTRELTLRVLYDFQMPPFYETADPDATSEAIRAGSYTYLSMRNLRVEDEVKHLKEAHATEISTLTASYDANVTQINKEQAELLTSSLKIQKDTVIEPLQAHIAKQQAELTQRLAELEERRRTLDALHVSAIAAAEEKVRLQYKETVDRLTAENKQLKTYFTAQTEQLTALNEFVRRAVPSTQKSRDSFITLFRDELVKTYNTNEQYSVVNVEFGRSHGYLMFEGDHQVLWDVRTDATPLTAADVATFLVNVKNNGKFPIGVLVSAYSPITGKNEQSNRRVEFQDGFMLVYLSDYEAMAGDRLASLMLLFQLWWQSGRNLEANKSLIQTLEGLSVAATKSRNDWKTHKVHMEETLSWMTNQVEDNEKKLQNALAQAKAMLLPK